MFRFAGERETVVKDWIERLDDKMGQGNSENDKRMPQYVVLSRSLSIPRAPLPVLFPKLHRNTTTAPARLNRCMDPLVRCAH